MNDELFRALAGPEQEIAAALGLDPALVIAGTLKLHAEGAAGRVIAVWDEPTSPDERHPDDPLPRRRRQRALAADEAAAVQRFVVPAARDWDSGPDMEAAMLEATGLLESWDAVPPSDGAWAGWQNGRVVPESAWIGDRPRSSPPVDPHPVLHWGSSEWLEVEARQREGYARLREAATYLRGLAAAGTPGDWEAMLLGSEGSSILAGRARVARVYESADAAWVSAMPPSVVGPLVAEWLESVAGSLECDEPANAANEAEQLAEQLLRHKARSS